MASKGSGYASPMAPPRSVREVYSGRRRVADDGRMWPFKRSAASKPDVRTSDDQIWLTEKSKIAGVVRAAEAAHGGGSDVLLVAHIASTATQLGEALAAAQREVDGLTSTTSPAQLLQRLRGRGEPTIVLATSAALGPSGSGPPAGAAPRQLTVQVAERYPLRERDDAVAAFAAGLGPSTSLVFHVSLEDQCMRAFAGES